MDHSASEELEDLGPAGAVAFPIGDGASLGHLVYRSSLPLSLETPDNRFHGAAHEPYLRDDLNPPPVSSNDKHVRNLVAVPVLPEPPSPAGADGASSPGGGGTASSNKNGTAAPAINIYDTVAVLVLVNKRGRLDYEPFSRADEGRLRNLAARASASLEGHFMEVFEANLFSAVDIGGAAL